jgi:protein-S-isoprenylcysteine O-methyltransferase Ste14
MYTDQTIIVAKRNIRWLSFVLADITLIWGAFCFYVFNSWYGGFLTRETQLALYSIACLYSVVCIINNVRNRNNEDVTSPGFTFISTLGQIFNKLSTGNSAAPVFADPRQKERFLFILVKLFFIPLMLQFAIGNTMELAHEVKRVMKTGMDSTFVLWFNNIFFPLTVTSFFLIDTVTFLFGYLFESEKLGNKLRSVDSTWSGWLVAIICYNPFNELLSKLAPFHASTYAYFDQSMNGTFALRLAIVLLLFVYTWASVSLGTRASNLTNRGIVSKGAYKLVRHPAYISKVAAWWVMLIPLLSNNPMVVTGMFVWTILYFLRAITEERHLSQDPDYVEYCRKVKWRFIPGVY